MRRVFPFAVALLAVCVALGASAVLAQDSSGWPAYKLDRVWRGPGFYLSWIKIALAWLVFLGWVRTADWVNAECQQYKLDHLRWNPIVVGSFLAAMVLFWILPWFWLGWLLLLAAYAAPLTAFILHRNKHVDAADQVFTRPHLEQLAAKYLGRVGVKIKGLVPAPGEARPGEDGPREIGPPVRLMPRPSSTGEASLMAEEMAKRLMAAQKSPGFEAARQALADGLLRRATSVMLDYASQAVGVRHLVDGVWLDAPPLDRETADPLLEALKLLCGMNPEDRQRRQEGALSAVFRGATHHATVVSQGIQTGERVLVQFEATQTRFKSLDDLGMRAKLQEQLKELLSAPNGLVLFSAMPTAGLRSTTNVALRSTDRFTRDFAALEDDASRYEEVENVPVTTYRAGGEDTPRQALMRVLRAEPNVVVVRDLRDGDMLSLLCQFAVRDRLFISTIRARDSVEALLRVLALKVPPAEFAAAVSGVVNQRLVRKLCENCKEAYAPPPQVLQQLNIPAGSVPTFYRPPQPPPVEPTKKKKPEVCAQCGGVGYVGRTAIFELLVVERTIRQILRKTPKLELLRQAAQKAGMRNLQEEGFMLVANGITSLQELSRALK